MHSRWPSEWWFLSRPERAHLEIRKRERVRERDVVGPFCLLHARDPATAVAVIPNNGCWLMWDFSFLKRRIPDSRTKAFKVPHLLSFPFLFYFLLAFSIRLRLTPLPPLYHYYTTSQFYQSYYTSLLWWGDGTNLLFTVLVYPAREQHLKRHKTFEVLMPFWCRD